ncbi:MAG: hypothetical protein Q7S03_02700 [bacterium]|nr:hypothetical protein [bacterium]
MELPEVLTKLTHRENETAEYFWATELWDNSIKSALWIVDNHKAKVVSLGSHETWQEDADDLVNACDRSLATASERYLQEGQEQPSKVIFGLPYSWLEDDKIAPEKQQLLQSVCEKLDLKAIGFVLTVDALNHQLRLIEGVPPSAILISPQKGQVMVAVLNQGKVERVEQVVRSAQIAEDVYEGLVRIDAKNLPARMLLFDSGEDMETVRETLVEFAWQPKLPFLHLPKIDILPVDLDITSVCLAGGSEVARSLGFQIVEAEATMPSESSYEAAEATEEEPETHETEPDLGFVQGKDIKETVKEENPEEEKETSEEESNVVVPAEESFSPFPVPQETPHKGKFNLPLPSFKFKIPPLPTFRLGRLTSRLPLLILPFLVIGGGGGAAYWYLPKADVIIYIAPKSLTKEFELRVDPNQEVVDSQGRILPGKMIDVEASDEKIQNTSGKKTVGDKAKGDVTIYNTGGTKQLIAGTTLTGPGGLKYTLDQDVTVSSSSGAASAEVTKTSITAANIGAEYNLAADSIFAIGSLDKFTIQAKNESAFSGGTSRQIPAVSDDDLKSLAARLTDELKNKAKDDLLSSIPPDKKAIESSFSTKETGRNFDHKAGDEATDLTLSLKIKASMLVFSQDDFLVLVQQELSDSIPSGYGAQEEQIKPQFEVKKQDKDGSYLFKVTVTANLLPRVDPAEIAENIKGKYPDVVQEYLTTLPGFTQATIDIHPKLPAQLSVLPRVDKNIRIELRNQ